MKALLAALLIASSAAGSSPWSCVMQRAEAVHNLRIAWMGTSITCGLGSTSESHQFTNQVNKLFEQRTRAKIVSRNFCFGGAHSILQIALLKNLVLPWKPDLIIAELGTLDELYKPVSLPAIEAFLRLAYSARIPVITVYPYTTYVDVARDGLRKLCALYGCDVIDMADYALKRRAVLKLITTDGCHPNDSGQALIADAFAERLKSATIGPADNSRPAPPNRIYAPDLSRVNFQPIALDDAAERVTPRLFDGRGFALKIPAGRTFTQSFHGSIIGLLFQFGCAPGKISYSLDGGAWSDVQIAPEWFLNYLLRTDLNDAVHSLQLRIAPKPGKPAVLEGLLVN